MWTLLLLAATVRSFAHLPLGLSDRNSILCKALFKNICQVKNAQVSSCWICIIQLQRKRMRYESFRGSHRFQDPCWPSKFGLLCAPAAQDRSKNIANMAAMPVFAKSWQLLLRWWHNVENKLCAGSKMSYG